MTSRRRRRRRRRRRVCSGLLPAATGGRGREPSRSLFSAQWDVRGKRGGKKKIKIRKVCARVRCAAARWADGKGLGSGGCEETYQLGPGAIRNGCGARSGWKRQQSTEVRPAVEITGSIGQWVNSLTSLLTRVIIGRGLSRGQGRAGPGPGPGPTRATPQIERAWRLGREQKEKEAARDQGGRVRRVH